MLIARISRRPTASPSFCCALPFPKAVLLVLSAALQPCTAQCLSQDGLTCDSIARSTHATGPQPLQEHLASPTSVPFVAEQVCCLQSGNDIVSVHIFPYLQGMGAFCSYPVFCMPSSCL
ncbi:hypothetical protein V8C86DRAFT_23796 [Haematococcus lacustris]